jgi:hypothetical protein
MGKRQPERAIGLLDIADRGEARIRLGGARAVDQTGLAGVAGPRVDLVEPDQDTALQPPLLMTASKATASRMVIA